MLLGTAALSHSTCEQQFPLGGCLSWRFPGLAPFGGADVFRVLLPKKLWEELEQGSTFSVVWGRDYQTHSSHFPGVSKAAGRYFMEMCLPKSPGFLFFLTSSTQMEFITHWPHAGLYQGLASFIPLLSSETFKLSHQHWVVLGKNSGAPLGAKQL